MTLLRQRMLEDLRIRNYAPSTVTCYVRAVAQFAKHFNQSPDHLGPDQIRSWQLYLLKEKPAQGKRIQAPLLHPGHLRAPLFLQDYPEQQNRHRMDSVASL